MSDEDGHAVRLRGIYTTALTRLFLDAGWDVVDASGPIERRFDAEFPVAAADVRIETTDDRLGVGLAGRPAAVGDAAASLDDLALDTFAWDDPTPAGAVFDGVVTGTRGRGAVVDLGAREGYLPFGRVDGHVEAGDVVRVQVREPTPPWAGDRPVLDTALRASTGLVELRPGSGEPTVDTSDEAAARELLGMADLLDVAAPDDWRIRWRHAATAAPMDALAAALERAVSLADRLAEPREVEKTDGTPVERLAPRRGRWYFFGRASRFALDDRRRAVTTTLAGHHRIKAGSAAASAGVDLAEALCGTAGADGDSAFPFDVVVDAFGPGVGDTVELAHGKPDGRLLSLGSAVVTDREDETLTLRRELAGGGRYDALDVPKAAGDTATTTVREGRWWYPTVYRREAEVLGTYVNVCTPVECFPEAIRYVDLHVDVIKHADGTVERVDDDELEAAVEAGDVREELAEKARSVARALEAGL